jgi:hypothetical protein
MSIVRPTLSSNLVKLENEFTHGYREGAAVFYVLVTNKVGESSEFTSEEMNGWSSLRKKLNEEFIEYVESIPELQFMMSGYRN